MATSGNKSAAIAAVEAAYDLDGTMSRWLTGLAQAAQTQLDLGMGVQAVLYSRNGAQFVAAEQGLVNSPPELGNYVVELARMMTAEGQGQVAALPSGLYAYRQTEAGQKEPEVFDRVCVQGAPSGIRDWVAMVAPTRDAFVVLGGLTRARGLVPAKKRHRWNRVAPHLAAGLRLRTQLAQAGGLRTEAILSPTGQLEHAEGESCKSPRLREALRRAVLDLQQARRPQRDQDAEEALPLWPALVEGRWSLIDRFDSDGRRYVIAVENGPSQKDPRALTPREQQVVRLAQEGLANKEIAEALHVSASAVATQLSCALSKLALARREMLLTERGVQASLTQRVELQGLRVVVNSTLLRPPALDELSRSENLVVQGIVRGLSNEAIAGERCTAVSTVANQIHDVFRKLKVQSRAELVRLVIERCND